MGEKSEAQASESAAETQSQALPVLMLTDTIGDTGVELVRGGATLYTLKNFDLKTPQAMVYLDVDTFDDTSPENKQALELARTEGWPVVIESFAWNSTEVARVTRELFPEASGKSITDTTAIVEANSSGWSAKNTHPSEVASKAGIATESPNEQDPSRSESVAKLRAPNSHLAHFANLAYTRHLPSPIVVAWGNLGWDVRYDGDVVKVFSRRFRYPGQHNNNPGYISCIVSWRGTSASINPWSWGDWLRNFESQFTFHAEVYPGSPIKVGRGYRDRYFNQRQNLNLTDCGVIGTTGHSLGGGMAELFAFYYRLDPRFRRLEAYNPARVGNSEFVRELQRYDDAAILVFCRHGDPVFHVPVGLSHAGTQAPGQHGCDYWGPQLDWSPLGLGNHNLNHWF